MMIESGVEALKVRKIIFAVFLSLCLVVTMTPAFAFANTTDPVGGISSEGEDISIDPGQEVEVLKFTHESADTGSAYRFCVEADVDWGNIESATSSDLQIRLYEDVLGNWVQRDVSYSFGVTEDNQFGIAYGWIYYGPGVTPQLRPGSKYSIRVYNYNETTGYEVDYWYEKSSSGFTNNPDLDFSYITNKAGYPNFAGAYDANYDDGLAVVTDARTSDDSVLICQSTGDGVMFMGLKKGTATITVDFSNGDVAEKTINVKNGPPELSDSFLYLHRGDKYQLSILYNSSKVKWTTSKKKVAKVSKKGLVTAVNPGKCTITAKVAGKKLKCKVEVYRYTPDFAAKVVGYDNVDKTISVLFVNNGETYMKVNSAKAKLKAKPDGGKTVTRYLKLESGKTAMVGSGEAVTVNFKIKKGSFNWDPQDPEVTYYFKYDGKTYQAKAYPAWRDSAYKSGKYWWLTYLDDEADLYNYYL
ncbi:MAG: Ig-like domain-containing protein [Bacillota bacterium]|nr:Ig-like domain-containing protein [Bacillota bacterium]